MGKIEQLRAEPKPNTAKFWYGNGEIRLEVDGVVAGIEFTFKGKPTFNWSLPDGWTAAKGARKAIIYTLGTQPLTEIIGSYKGYMKVTNVIVADWDAKKVPTSIHIEQIHFWEKLSVTWETFSQAWETLKRGYTS